MEDVAWMESVQPPSARLSLRKGWKGREWLCGLNPPVLLAMVAIVVMLDKGDLDDALVLDVW